MKKQARKLGLNKETLRNLGEEGLREVAGGSRLQSCLIFTCNCDPLPKDPEEEFH